jgi:hypothetical protein
MRFAPNGKSVGSPLGFFGLGFGAVLDLAIAYTPIQEFGVIAACKHNLRNTET